MSRVRASARLAWVSAMIVSSLETLAAVASAALARFVASLWASMVCFPMGFASSLLFLAAEILAAKSQVWGCSGPRAIEQAA
eukprot:4886717-Heterocapsa_arctica.AAC.1